MKTLEFIFWSSLTGLAFIYLFYGAIIFLINRIKGSSAPDPNGSDENPSVAVVIAAYNEEQIIERKLRNTLALNYESEKLRIYVVADGSSDRTCDIVKRFPEVELLWTPERSGKMAAINRVMALVEEEIAVFTDANVELRSDSLRAIIRHYSDPRTGGVSGEKTVVANSGNAASTEGVYWKYESFLKREDARFSSLIGAAGEFFSIRTELFVPQPVDTLLDDFMISMAIIQKGYRIAYEPGAIASEPPSVSIQEEYQRKTRIGAGGLQSIARSWQILNPFRYGSISFQYAFHRMSRWILAPLFLPALFLSNFLLLGYSPLYTALFLMQVSFHLAALMAFLLEKREVRIKILYIPFYFNFMHFCILVGWYRYLSGTQSVKWQKASRDQIR